MEKSWALWGDPLVANARGQTAANIYPQASINSLVRLSHGVTRRKEGRGGRSDEDERATRKVKKMKKLKKIVKKKKWLKDASLTLAVLFHSLRS